MHLLVYWRARARALSRALSLSLSLRARPLEGRHSYTESFGENGWGASAQAKLVTTQGKSFRHEKTKKKRGSYRGGTLRCAAFSNGADLWCSVVLCRVRLTAFGVAVCCSIIISTPKFMGAAVGGSLRSTRSPSVPVVLRIMLT